MWKEQKQRVDELGQLASARSAETHRVLARMRAWKQEFAGSVDMLAWAFAAGTWWAASRRSRAGLAGLASMLLTASKVAHLSWGLVERASRIRSRGKPKKGASMRWPRDNLSST